VKTKAKFIVLEGLDATGKSTQLDLLGDFFNKNKIKYTYIHFPVTNNDSPVFGELIARFLRGEFGSIAQVHPDLVALLFAGDRFNSADYIRKKLDSGCYIISDRYVFSNIAYQCAKLKTEKERENLMYRILSMEYEYFRVPKPDISIFMHVPFSFVEEKLKSKRSGDARNYLKGKEDIHEVSFAFQKEVEKIYLRMAKTMPDKIKYLNCGNENNVILSPEIINEKIIMLLQETKILQC